MPSAPPPASNVPTATGSVGCGRFTLQQRVARGAAGEVWKALDEHTGQTVAVKRLVEPGPRDDAVQVRERFVEEGRIASRLQHPDIAACIARGEDEGRPWIALQWLGGEDLSQHVQRQHLLPGAVAVRLAARIALALDHAHRQGVVHRDLKPSNIHVNLPEGAVTLTDFGVARQEDASRTATGMVLGTPAYMAPEQLAGAPADARSDLYALGVVLFELLAGRRPHEASTLGELLRRLAREDAPDVRTLAPDVPQAVARELARVLARDPARRHASGSALAQALTQALEEAAGDDAAPG